MNEETKLPDGLQLAVKLLAQIGDDDSDRAIAAVHAACDLAQRVADLEAERDEWQRIASAYSPAKELAASLKQAKASGDAARKERDELRAKYDELLVALHGIGTALGIPEGDRSPYSVTCGVLERVNRLAEIEAQEPVAWLQYARKKPCARALAFEPGLSRVAVSNGFVEAPLFTRPTPAQAVPDPVALLKSLGPMPWETSPEAHAQARLICDFSEAFAAAPEAAR